MASVRELSADAISVEKERYQPRQAPEIKRVDSPILVAKVARLEGRQAKAGARELWRNN
jgi:hypothetical protein